MTSKRIVKKLKNRTIESNAYLRTRNGTMIPATYRYPRRKQLEKAFHEMYSNSQQIEYIIEQEPFQLKSGTTAPFPFTGCSEFHVFIADDEEAGELYKIGGYAHD